MKTRSKGAEALGQYKREHGLTHAGLAERIAATLPELGDCKARSVQDMVIGARRPSLSMQAKIEALTEIRAGAWFE